MQSINTLISFPPFRLPQPPAVQARQQQPAGLQRHYPGLEPQLSVPWLPGHQGLGMSTFEPDLFFLFCWCIYHASSRHCVAIITGPCLWLGLAELCCPPSARTPAVEWGGRGLTPLTKETQACRVAPSASNGPASNLFVGFQRCRLSLLFSLSRTKSLSSSTFESDFYVPMYPMPTPLI